LPPAERTVGQVVAESIRLYGRQFFPALALGVPAAAMVALTAWAPEPARTAAVLVVGSALSSGAIVRAVQIAYPEVPRDPRPRLVTALAVGVVVFLPVVLVRVVVFPGIYLLAFVWLAATIFAVPAVLVEGMPGRHAFVRSLRLARADPVHAIGGLVTLAITITLTALVLTFLLRGFGDQGIRVATLLALLVVTPLFFLGAAVLYGDQAARVRLDGTD
jgi:hypothetical protein